MSAVTSTKRRVPVPCAERRAGICTREVWNVNMAVCDACFAAIHAEQAPALLGEGWERTGRPVMRGSDRGTGNGQRQREGPDRRKGSNRANGRTERRNRPR